jgi:hypothetical protein
MIETSTLYVENEELLNIRANGTFGNTVL